MTVFHVLKDHFNVVADLDGKQARAVAELVCRDDAFGLEAASMTTKSLSMRMTSPISRPPGWILETLRLCSNSSAKDSLMIVH